MLGGNLNPEPTINHMDKMCLPHPIHGTSLFSGNPQFLGDTILKIHNNLFPPQGTHLYPPYGKTPNSAYNSQNPSGYPPLTHVSQNT
jgi:hypothetical protein